MAPHFWGRLSFKVGHDRLRVGRDELWIRRNMYYNAKRTYDFSKVLRHVGFSDNYDFYIMM